MASEALRSGGHLPRLLSGVRSQLMEWMRAPAAPPLRSQSGTGRADGGGGSGVAVMALFRVSLASSGEVSRRVQAPRACRARSTRIAPRRASRWPPPRSLKPRNGSEDRGICANYERPAVCKPYVQTATSERGSYSVLLCTRILVFD